jgi:hypothetical protein
MIFAKDSEERGQKYRNPFPTPNAVALLTEDFLLRGKCCEMRALIEISSLAKISVSAIFKK